jgi:acetyl esterase/lipase
MEKSLDPTLGLYACYAYAQAGMDEEIRSVRSYMRDDLGAALFDVQMLSNDNGPDSLLPLAPFCPMLTQGWNLLRPSNIKLASVLVEASASLSNSLWSTFTGKGAEQLFNAVKSGKLK